MKNKNKKQCMYIYRITEEDNDEEIVMKRDVEIDLSLNAFKNSTK